jgi:hypothetical protein
MRTFVRDAAARFQLSIPRKNLFPFSHAGKCTFTRYSKFSLCKRDLGGSALVDSNLRPCLTAGTPVLTSPHSIINQPLTNK